MSSHAPRGANKISGKSRPKPRANRDLNLGQFAPKPRANRDLNPGCPRPPIQEIYPGDLSSRSNQASIKHRGSATAMGGERGSDPFQGSRRPAAGSNREAGSDPGGPAQAATSRILRPTREDARHPLRFAPGAGSSNQDQNQTPGFPPADPDELKGPDPEPPLPGSWIRCLGLTELRAMVTMVTSRSARPRPPVPVTADTAIEAAKPAPPS